MSKSFTKVKHGIASAGHQKTAQAATQILEAGGNAFDAAVGAGFAACVAEAVLASLGGGGFLLAHSNKASAGQQNILYDFFVQTPQSSPAGKKLDFYPIQADFGPTTQEFHIGLGSMATPGVVAGFFKVHEDLGSIPIKEVLQPAINLAREGVKVNPFQEYLFGVVAPIYEATHEATRVFGSPNQAGKRVGAGEVLRYPSLALTLEALSAEGPRIFYEGEIAGRLIKLCNEGGLIIEKDLQDYTAIKRKPLKWHYRGHRMLSNPPPSSGGILISFALELLEARSLDPKSFSETETLRALIEAMALTNQARLEALAQDPHWEEACQTLQQKAFVEKYRQELLGKIKAPRGTTHLNVMDRQGNAASLSLSNGEGCGHVLPGTDIMLNNMLGEEDINPQGFHHYPAGTRMVSMMSPSLSFARDGKVLALGSGGSNRIRSAILQVLKNCVDHGMSLSEAVRAPRLHFESGLLSVEPGFEPKALGEILEKYPNYHLWEELNLFFGGVHVVSMDSPNNFSGVGDLRRHGGVAFV